MRLITIVAAAAVALFAGTAAPDTASAAHKRHHHHAKHHHHHHAKRVVAVVPHVHYSAYAHVYAIDPYAYSYHPRGYYPYYGSHYWVQAPWVRARDHALYNHIIVAPTRYDYGPSWGYPKTWCHKACRYHGHHHHRGHHPRHH